MDIYIYNNDQKDSIKLPVIPESVGISSPQSIETFNTIGQGDIKLIGELGNRQIKLDAFFAVKDYPFLKDSSLTGMEYVNKLQAWRAERKPLYVYVTDLEFATRCVIENIEYQVKDGSGDIYYSISISEYVYAKEKAKRPEDKPKTADKDKVSVSKDGYTNVNDKIRNNVRSGPGIGYEITRVASTVRRLRSLRRYGEYVQVKGGWILKDYLK